MATRRFPAPRGTAERAAAPRQGSASRDAAMQQLRLFDGLGFRSLGFEALKVFLGGFTKRYEGKGCGGLHFVLLEEGHGASMKLLQEVVFVQSRDAAAGRGWPHMTCAVRNSTTLYDQPGNEHTASRHQNILSKSHRMPVEKRKMPSMFCFQLIGQGLSLI